MPSANGFTLIEMVVVVAVLGLIGSLVLGRAPAPGGHLALRAASGNVAFTLQSARGRAIATRRPVLVTFDPGRRTMQVDAGAVWPVPPGIGLAVVTTMDQDGIQFMPDGSASGGRVELAAAGWRVQVGVDWISGRVTRQEFAESPH